MSGSTSQRAAVFVLLFALLMLLIIYSSSSGTEVFPYSALRGRARRPPNLRHWGSLTAHCHQCAIITSSSHLLGTHLGAEIDQTECTIRMNDAPTTGYEADVGNKTTFRVVAHSSVYRVLKRPQEFVNKTPETILIFWGPPVKMQKGLLKIIQRVGASFPNMTAYIVSPHRMKQFDELFRGETGKDREKSRSWLSTGWFTMGIAVELCDTVHVYGMVPPNYCSVTIPRTETSRATPVRTKGMTLPTWCREGRWVGGATPHSTAGTFCNLAVGFGGLFSLLVPVFGFPAWSHAMLVTHRPLTNYSEAFGRPGGVTPWGVAQHRVLYRFVQE
ncbi:alpha-N-acetylgalactosaminide alpha-2,6-sialyltransferase 6 isoform X2 [Meleagris gallopavo]|uniref:alpha-N-acetylgalactosaminide alpha-2,6-sialyltransferase 6 isoform X2 n=1 Tax=Meleagris gallopavo TaxID=9103 RepID=UPI000549C977|nr:alpha-N-acetylgalactosaminide alpha-2,6-sialyltransferase 6 isoform X2 [Meleagris gallopavo]